MCVSAHMGATAVEENLQGWFLTLSCRTWELNSYQQRLLSLSPLTGPEQVFLFLPHWSPLRERSRLSSTLAKFLLWVRADERGFSLVPGDLSCHGDRSLVLSGIHTTSTICCKHCTCRCAHHFWVSLRLPWHCLAPLPSVLSPAGGSPFLLVTLFFVPLIYFRCILFSGKKKNMFYFLTSFLLGRFSRKKK